MTAELHLGSISIGEISMIVGGEVNYFGADENSCVTNVAIDSRDCREGSLFVAIKGERSDGHDYIASALEKGAVCVFAQYMPSGVEVESKYAIILVEDPIVAVGMLAKEYKRRQSCRVVAVTGSVGKTTTKEFVCSVLNEKYKTYKSEGNHNNELGLPLTLLGLPLDCEYAVLEMGMSALGEIEYLSKIAEPDIAIITNIGTSHLEHLKTRENICRAKLEIVAGLKKGGKLFLNGDEPLLRAWDSRAYDVSYISLMQKGDINVCNISGNGEGMCFDIESENKRSSLAVSVIGEHNLYAAAFAFACGEAAGMSVEQIARGLGRFENVGGRQNIYSVSGITIIDDCYNASPESMRAALTVLNTLGSKKNSRRIALLGDMRELGENSKRYHYELGEFAYGKVDMLFSFGVLASAIADGAIHAGLDRSCAVCCTDPSEHDACGAKLCEVLLPSDVLLVKASRAMEAEKIIGYIKTHIQR
jgi:UDP-N-acetylmuramoyl-tripeptide--D-alanyl-D-alanine ligase